jgi:hypothetical protein
MNALGALFPEGERFFVRSVRPYLDRVDEPLRSEVEKFMAQEVRHGGAHDSYNEVLASQGIDLSRFFRVFARLCRSRTPRFLAPLNLSITVAVEHFTAVTAHVTLRDDLLEGADPRMRRLFEWHALEELEHKAVAFDVLREVSGSYLLRMLGFVLVLLFAPLFLMVPFVWILAKARLVFSPKAYWDVFYWSFVEERGAWKFLAALLPYFRPGFHPDEADESELLARHSERLEERIA